MKPQPTDDLSWTGPGIGASHNTGRTMTTKAKRVYAVAVTRIVVVVAEDEVEAKIVAIDLTLPDAAACRHLEIHTAAVRLTVPDEELRAAWRECL